MKQRVGALLCLAFGVVLIFGGVGFSAEGAVGSIVPTSSTAPPPVDPCQLTFSAKRDGLGGFCPMGTINITETTTNNGQTPPAYWTVTLNSANCDLPQAAVGPRTIANNGTTSYTDLFVYTNNDRVAQCTYTLSETMVAKFEAAFTPAGPYTFSDEFNVKQNRAQPHVVGLVQPVVLSNTGQKVASSSPAAPSTSATVATELPTSISAIPASSSAAPVLATTGPHGQVRGTLIAGLVLCLFGGVLLVAGRRPRGARHS